MPNPNPAAATTQSSAACPDSVEFSSNFSEVATTRAPREPGREPAFPVEGMGHYRRKIVKSRLPVKYIVDALARRDDASGVAVPARRNFHAEIDSRDAFDRFDHFANRKTVTVTAIECQRCTARARVLQSQRMCGG